MQIVKSRKWLRDKILSDPDIATDAGVPSAVLEDLGVFLSSELVSTDEQTDENVIRLKQAFGLLIHQLRRREELMISELAQKASITEDELRLIEHDPHYKPRPRTVHQLAEYFQVSKVKLMKLSGATLTYDQNFQEAAFRYAAKSDDLSALTQDEQKLLNEYVKFLNQGHDS